MASCSDGGGPANLQSPTTGQVTVTAQTTGDAPDPDGYTVSVDGASSGSVAVNGSVTLTLAAGSHDIELQGVATNCSVSGSNPRAVSVTVGGSTTAAFSVSCPTPTGALEVSTVTTGATPDPNGYALSVDGASQGTIGVLATRTLTLDEGSHSVELADVAGNCVVTGGDTRQVNVTADQTEQLAFAVDCPTPTGALDVTTTTTGPNPDPDGYSVEVEGTDEGAIGVDETVSLTVAEGTRSVLLTGVAPNCIVADENPRDVDVLAGQTASLTFAVDCQPGAIEVTTQTTGGDPDPDGYAISIDGSSAGAIGNAETKSFGADAGTRSVELTGLAPNCTVSGQNPRDVDVTVGQAAPTTFQVDCPTVQGTVEVTTNTTGASPDPDGYSLMVGGQPQGAIGTNETRSIDVDPGTVQVFISGLAFNCTISGANPRNETVTANQTTTTTFDVDCPSSPVVSISSPSDGGSVAVGGNVTFTGSANDPEDGPLSGSQLVWTSNLQGEIGTGESFSTSSLVSGPHEITLTATDSDAGEGTDLVSFTVIRASGPGYQIDIRVSPGSSLTASQRAAVDSAVAKWEAIITGDLADVPFSSNGGTCGGATVPAVSETIDDLMVYLEFELIDGPGSILGSAGWCVKRTAGNLSLLGGMRFDTADLDNIEIQGLLDDVILHELGHVIGVGTLWSTFGFLQDPSNTSGPIVDTHFNGPDAIAAFDAIGGTSYTGGAKVPVENDNTEFGNGSLNGHWRESVFANELMTPRINGGSNPLSIVTAESLDDMGYTIDPSAADPYSQTFTLRAAPQAAGFSIDLHDDIWMGPLYTVDQAGNVRRIR
jgi:hypothetical protein